jgi:hypothetical protein
LVYGVQFGGDGADKGNDIAVDAAGRAYITGQTEGAEENNFDIVNGIQTSCGRSGAYCTRDAFVTIINADGSELDYSTFLGGGANPDGLGGTDEGHAIAVDSAGYIYVAGMTMSESFPLANPAQAELGGSDASPDGFITKLTPAGDAFVYSTYLGGRSVEHLLGLGVDEQGNATVAGYTLSNDFPVVEPIQPNLAIGDTLCHLRFCEEAIIAQYDAGGALTFSSYLGGILQDYGVALTVHQGDVYLAGKSESLDFPTTAGVVQPAKLPYFDGFVSKIRLSAGNPTPPTQPNQLYLPLIQLSPS